jgi:hypothetical protein
MYVQDVSPAQLIAWSDPTSRCDVYGLPCRNWMMLA